MLYLKIVTQRNYFQYVKNFSLEAFLLLASEVAESRWLIQAQQLLDSVFTALDEKRVALSVRCDSLHLHELLGFTISRLTTLSPL